MTPTSRLIYAREADLPVDEFRRVLVEAGLGGSRPVGDNARLAAMIGGASLIVTARLERPDGQLVGLARGVSDLAWCCYLSELAVCPAAQRSGTGRGLLDEARRHLGDGVSLILASVPEAVGFYERAGMVRIPDAFWFRRTR